MQLIYIKDKIQRPGNGAPRDKSHKENLIKMLHFNDNVEKTPTNVELLTLERLPVKV